MLCKIVLYIGLLVVSTLPIKHPIVILAPLLESVFTSYILNIQPILCSYDLHLQTLIFSMALGRFPLGTLNRDKIGNWLSWSNYKAGLFNFVWWEFICLTPNLKSLHINAIKTIGSDSILASHFRKLYLIKIISQVKKLHIRNRNVSNHKCNCHKIKHINKRSTIERRKKTGMFSKKNFSDWASQSPN